MVPSPACAPAACNEAAPSDPRPSPAPSPSGPRPSPDRLTGSVAARAVGVTGACEHMTNFIAALALAFGVVFVAELGDKTQLLAINYGARYSIRTVAIGLTIGYAIANVVATIIGGILGAALPDRLLQIVGGFIFLAFAIATLRRVDATEDEASPTSSVASRSTLTVVMSIAASIAVAEMGDKTQIATATLASQSSPVGVWIGATLGAASSGMVGAGVGNLIGDRVPARGLQIASAILFAAFAVAMLAGWF